MATQNEIEEILSTVIARVSKIEGVQAIVLGGSRARGTADERSDIDLGIYYDGEHPFSTVALGAAAQELDDRHSEGLVTGFGDWGPAVNGGGWLEIRGRHVDFIYRELGVKQMLRDGCRPKFLRIFAHQRLELGDRAGRREQRTADVNLARINLYVKSHRMP